MRIRNTTGLLSVALLTTLALTACHDDEDIPPVSNTGVGDITAIGLQLVADQFVSPVVLTESPDGSGRIFVVDQAGVIRIIQNGQVLPELFLDVRSKMVTLMPDFDERGLLGLAFHPSFASNGRVFVYYSAPLRTGAPAGFDHTATISEFSAPSGTNTVDLTTEHIILQVDEPQFNHNGGTLAFGPDGRLYISFGDGGEANDVGLGHPAQGNGQELNTLLGKVLRIDVDNVAPYAIPSDNPFIGVGMGEIWAMGFRNPYRMSFDMGGERSLFVGDVGQDLWEEVDIVTRGGNYGWNIREGFHCFDKNSPMVSPATCATTGARGEELLNPILEYGNAAQPGGLGIAVVGGFVYRGSRNPGLAGRYVFGDYSSSFTAPAGKIFVAGAPAVAGEPWPMRELGVAQRTAGLGAFVMGIGQDASGEIYVLTSQTGAPNGTTGRVYRMVPEFEGEPAPADTGMPMPMPMVPANVQQQITSGQMLYGQNCARCHGTGGMGTALGPALVGMGALPRVPPPERMVRTTEFVTAADVYAFASVYMPADAPGTLPMQTYLDILAFALSANGFMLTEPLATTNAAQIPLQLQP